MQRIEHFSGSVFTTSSCVCVAVCLRSHIYWIPLVLSSVITGASSSSSSSSSSSYRGHTGLRLPRKFYPCPFQFRVPSSSVFLSIKFAAYRRLKISSRFLLVPMRSFLHTEKLIQRPFHDDSLSVPLDQAANCLATLACSPMPNCKRLV